MPYLIVGGEGKVQNGCGTVHNCSGASLKCNLIADNSKAEPVRTTGLVVNQLELGVVRLGNGLKSTIVSEVVREGYVHIGYVPPSRILCCVHLKIVGAQNIYLCVVPQCPRTVHEFHRVYGRQPRLHDAANGGASIAVG